jgi:asparagine synthase (glutamine-hydrolysing)
MHSVLLKDTDQMSMAHALEVRVPFLDHKLVEFVLRLPASYKWGASPKNLLVESLGTLLPPELVNRPKMGFVLPWEKWLKAELKDFAEEEIQQLEAVNYLNFERILHIWKSFQNNEGKYSWSRVWPFVVLGHSMRKYGT